MKSTTYGQKGGVGATAGRKSETIEATFAPGVVGRKRVFFGQRWLTYVEAEDGKSFVQAWKSEDEARAHLGRVRGDDYPVQLIARGELI